MKQSFQAKIEVLLDKLNLLYSNIKESEEVPQVELQLMLKYNNQLQELLAGLQDDIRKAPESSEKELKEEPMTTPKQERPKVAEETPKEEREQPITFVEPLLPSEEREPAKAELNIPKPSPDTNGNKAAEKQEVEKTPPVIEEKSFIEPSERAASNHQLEEYFYQKDQKKSKLIAEETDDVAEEEDYSLNTRFKGEEKVLVDKLHKKTINDLRTDIDLNNKFWFINNLFDGDSESYKRAITQLNEQVSFPEAENFINNQLISKYNWDKKEKVTMKFFETVRKRFH